MNVSELKTMDPPPAVGAGRRSSPYGTGGAAFTPSCLHGSVSASGRCGG
jgi:hypothetical protein